MQLPRRVPWYDLAELEQVCAWIYDASSDVSQRQRALNKLSAWQNMTALPTSLAATLSLLTSLHLDKPGVSILAIRQSYAMSLTRLVNGLVDPLQQGVYARPIAMIAAQLGVPAWWVELRHAATHEDLPSVHVLRESAREAMDWLYRNYFVPTLTHSAPARSHTTYGSLAPTLKTYKSLMKSITRDASLANQTRAAIDRAVRDVERWLGEVRVVLSSGWGVSSDPDQEELQRGVMEALCDALLERGGLVPVSKKKRPTFVYPDLPSELSALWRRLLDRLRSEHPAFLSTLFSSMLQRLTSPGDMSERDTSFSACLVAWCIWLAEEWEDEIGGREEAVRLTCIAMAECGDTQLQGLQTMVKCLSASDPELQEQTSLLLSIAVSNRVSAWEDKDVDVMQARLEELEAVVQPLADSPAADAMPVSEESIESLAPGWRKLTDQEWHPCPIGWLEVR